MASTRLDLDDGAGLCRRSLGDDEIPLLSFFVALNDLPDRALRVHDRRPRRVGLELRERLQSAPSRGGVGQREDVRFLRSRPVTEACSTWIRPWSNNAPSSRRRPTSPLRRTQG